MSTLNKWATGQSWVANYDQGGCCGVVIILDHKDLLLAVGWHGTDWATWDDLAVLLGRVRILCVNAPSAQSDRRHLWTWLIDQRFGEQSILVGDFNLALGGQRVATEHGLSIARDIGGGHGGSFYGPGGLEKYVFPCWAMVSFLGMGTCMVLDAAVELDTSLANKFYGFSVRWHFGGNLMSRRHEYQTTGHVC